MEKKTGIVLILLLSAMILSAGGQGSSQGAATQAGGTALLPWKGEAIVFTGLGADLMIKEDPNAPIVQEYRKTTGNVSIKWDTAPWNDYDTKMNVYLMSGDLPDLTWARDTVLKAMTLGSKGIFLDWDKYKQYMPNMQRWIAKYPHLNNLLTDKKERFIISDVINADSVAEGWFYNTNLLRKAGYTSPPDDFDQMLEIMKKVKSVEPSADGFFHGNLEWSIYAFKHAMNAHVGMGWNRDTKKWIYGPTMDPNYKKLIEYLNKMYVANLFDPEMLSFSNVADARRDEIYDKGNYAFLYNSYSFPKDHWLSKGLPSPLEGMKPPKFEGKRYHLVTSAHDFTPYWGFMASSKVKNPELLAAYVDNIMSEKTAELYEWGIEGLTFRRTADGAAEYLPQFITSSGAIDSAKLEQLGVGKLIDPRYIHYNDWKLIYFGKWYTTKGDPGRASLARDIKAFKAGEYTPRFGLEDAVRPLMTADQNDEISKIMTPISTFVAEQQVKFITGDRSMSEWNDFIDQAKKMGDIDKVVAYYNSGRQFPLGERIFPDLPADLK